MYVSASFTALMVSAVLTIGMSFSTVGGAGDTFACTLPPALSSQDQRPIVWGLQLFFRRGYGNPTTQVADQGDAELQYLPFFVQAEEEQSKRGDLAKHVAMF